ncbi:PCYCGC motif-containing (lipo)protein [Bacillus sp. JJ1533]|uniref:PCYCGC motif-containing (lipo)protein n=1 Tax=Bacillus sp. JJ1533 TaxID=3122959 RepID=UPI0030000BA4
MGLLDKERFVLMKKIIIFLTLVLIFGLVGCSQNKENHESKSEDHVMGDIREETVSFNVMPSFLDGKSEDMVTIYKAAAMHQDLLESIPCYCGCSDSVGHRDNYDCFVNENKDDAIVWDDHGTKCMVCLEIAATSVMEYSKGKSPSEIRAMIDETYKEGYSTPTPTPMPEI